MRGLIVIISYFLVSGCGGKSSVGYGDDPPDSSEPIPVEIASILEANCEGCHAGAAFLRSLGALKAGAVYDMVSSGRMPKPPKSISDSDKKKLLDFLSL